MFTVPISTALRFVNFRLPFTSFRYSTGGQGPSKLDPSRLVRLSIRCAALRDSEVPIMLHLLLDVHLKHGSVSAPWASWLLEA